VYTHKKSPKQKFWGFLFYIFTVNHIVMKIKIFFLIAIVAFAITGAAIFVNASNENRENCELSKGSNINNVTLK